ncbi:MAG: hypothetical protein AAGB29_04565 [Planctomycetota bacterium]
MNLPFTLVVPTEVEAGYLREHKPVICGVGSTMARRCVDDLIDEIDKGSVATRGVVLAGFGGGLSDTLAVGDTVIPCVVTHAGDELRCGHRLVEAGRSLVTVDAVITDPAEKRSLGESSDAEVADMEGYEFARWCTEYGLEWVILRAISDGVDDALPEPIGDWVTPEGKTKVSAALTWAGIRPGRLAELTRLKARADKAGAALRAAVIRLAETWPPDASPD